MCLRINMVIIITTCNLLQAGLCLLVDMFLLDAFQLNPNKNLVLKIVLKDGINKQQRSIYFNRYYSVEFNREKFISILHTSLANSSVPR